MKRTVKFLEIALILCIIPVETGWASPGIFSKNQKPPKKKAIKIINAVRTADGSIKIDGKLNDPAWLKAPASDDFTQQRPDEGKPASQKTTIQVAYDAHNLYVAMRAFDTHPDSIYAQLTRRDQDSNGDWMGVGIDSYFDHRTAFSFLVNAVGVQRDLLMSGDGSSQNSSWNAVWRVGVSRDSSGWIAEFQIPFSQLRFSSGKNLVWGFQAIRSIYRRNELDFWSPQPRNSAGFVSNFGELRGLKKIAAPKDAEFLPYVTGSEETFPEEKGNPFRTGASRTLNAGLNFKYGLTSNITLDAAINPDFGQVEADPSELNLTAYETFFPEKRPFFVEGNEIFGTPLNVGDGDMANERLFYSRRIGGRPHYYPDVPDSAYVKEPKVTHILGAGKLTGKTAGGWSIGMLEAVTNQEKATIQDGNRRYKEIVEPYTNFSVLRLKKDFRKGRTTIGIIGTNVYREIPNENLDFLNKQAATGGFDISNRWGNDAYSVQFSLYGSTISGDKEAIQRAQKSSARYYQRPDATYLHYDPNRTSLSGLSSSFLIGKIAKGHWQGGTGYMMRTPGFDANDIGYMQSADYFANFLWFGYREYNPGKVFRDYGLNGSVWSSWNFGGERAGTGMNINLHFRLLNYWGGFFGFNRQMESLNVSALRGGPALKVPGRINGWFGVFSDNRKPVSLFIRAHVSRDDAGFRNAGIFPGLHVRPAGNFNFSFFVNYSTNHNDRQYVTTIEDQTGKNHYIMGHLNQNIVSFTTRINYTLTPNLSIQFYGQPFITAGKYSNFREVVHPRAARYADRFAPYDYLAENNSPDFNFKQFRSNLVIRWEYRPGSTLFLVWSQGRTNVEDNGNFDFSRDFTSLLKTNGDNVFLIKLNRWLSL